MEWSGEGAGGLDPHEVEFVGSGERVELIPSFTAPRVHLVCGACGPFRAGLPCTAPLWLAVLLRRRHKCRVVAPAWMNLDTLARVKEEEQRSRFFTKMPSEHYMVEAKLILSVAADDVPDSAEIRTIIKDIWDIRMSKLRTSIDTLMKSGGSYGRLDHLTMMEINSVKPLLPSAMDDLYHIQMMSRKHTNANASLNTSSFTQSSSSQT